MVAKHIILSSAFAARHIGTTSYSQTISYKHTLLYPNKRNIKTFGILPWFCYIIVLTKGVNTMLLMLMLIYPRSVACIQMRQQCDHTRLVTVMMWLLCWGGLGLGLGGALYLYFLLMMLHFKSMMLKWFMTRSMWRLDENKSSFLRLLEVECIEMRFLIDKIAESGAEDINIDFNYDLPQILTFYTSQLAETLLVAESIHFCTCIWHISALKKSFMSILCFKKALCNYIKFVT